MVDTEERGDCTGREKGREWKGREGKNVRNRGMGRNGKDGEGKERRGVGGGGIKEEGQGDNTDSKGREG